MNGDLLPIEIMARKEDWSQGISLYARKTTRALIVVAQPIQFEKGIEGAISPPFMRIDIHTAQQFIDELWQCGLRPSEGTGSAGSLKATENHLKDMTRIAFKQLGIK